MIVRPKWAVMDLVIGILPPEWLPSISHVASGLYSGIVKCMLKADDTTGLGCSEDRQPQM